MPTVCVKTLVVAFPVPAPGFVMRSVGVRAGSFDGFSAVGAGCRYSHQIQNATAARSDKTTHKKQPAVRAPGNRYFLRLLNTRS